MTARGNSGLNCPIIVVVFKRDDTTTTTTSAKEKGAVEELAAKDNKSEVHLKVDER